MEDRPTAEYRGDEIDLGKHFTILRKEWWKIALFSLGIGLLFLLKADGSVVTRETADAGFFAYILYQIAVTAGILIVATRKIL